MSATEPRTGSWDRPPTPPRRPPTSRLLLGLAIAVAIASQCAAAIPGPHGSAETPPLPRLAPESDANPSAAPSSAGLLALAAAAWNNGPAHSAFVHPLLETPRFPSYALAYDPADGYVLGISTAGTFDSSILTWTFENGSWTHQLLPHSPSAREGAAMTFDSRLGKIVLFGGLQELCDPNSTSSGGPCRLTMVNDTWTYARGGWTNVTVPGAVTPPPHYGSQFVDDASDGYDLLFGGLTGSSWIPGNSTAVWAYANGSWTQLLPNQLISHRSGQPFYGPYLQGAMAYDAADGYVVYFGGVTYTNSTGPGVPQATTWEFHQGNWTNLTGQVTGAPSPRIAAMMTWDTGLGQLLLFGGYNGTEGSPGAGSGPTVGVGGLLNDTYSYRNGTWSPVVAGAAPAPRAAGALVPDGPGVLLFGGWNFHYNTTYGLWEYGAALQDTWELANATGGSWTEVVPQLVPSRVTSESGAPILLTVGRAMVSDQTQISYAGLPAGCRSSDVANLTCTPSGNGSFAVSVTLSAGGQSTTSPPVRLQVYPALTVPNFDLTSSRIDVGQTVDASVVTEGGVGPFEFSYAGLPGGCGTPDGPTVSCRPAASGEFNISVVVVDALGYRSGQVGSLSVAPSLGLSVVESSAQLPVGSAWNITAVVTGGTGPIGVSFVGLPTGCAGTGRSSVECTPTATGDFTVVVSVQDATGATQVGDVSVNVVPLVAPGRGPPSGPTGLLGDLLASPWAGFAVGGAVALSAGVALLWNRRRLTNEGRALAESLAAGEGSPTDPPSDSEDRTPVDRRG